MTRNNDPIGIKLDAVANEVQSSFPVEVRQLEEPQTDLSSLLFSTDFYKDLRPKALTFCGVGCRRGELATLTAPAGVGKSRICEAIAASHTGKLLGLDNVDSLGFDVDLKTNEKILIVDTERINSDIFTAVEGIISRCGGSVKTTINNEKLKFNPDEKYLPDGKLLGVDFLCLKVMPPSKRMQVLRQALSYDKYGLVIVDGITDMGSDLVLNMENAEGVVSEFQQIAVDNDCTILSTIHKRGVEDQGRGHIGGEWLRKCALLVSAKNAEDKSIKELSTAKVRNGSDTNMVNYSWGNEEGMFITCEEVTGQAKEPHEYRADKHQAFVEQVFCSSKTLKAAKFKEQVSSISVPIYDRVALTNKMAWNNFGKSLSKFLQDQGYIKQEGKGLNSVYERVFKG